MSMPVLFVGHGSPMNAIEDNEFTRQWRTIGSRLRPKAILMISAHWFIDGTHTQDADEPDVINDMYGFPSELYEVNYHVRGSQQLTDLILQSISRRVSIRNDWGIDHGAWSVLNHMYPARDIPVVQLSIDANAAPEVHAQIGEELRPLRDQDVLIIGSGNVVHNLRRVSLDMSDGYPWGDEFDTVIKEKVLCRESDSILSYRDLGESARLSVPTTDHFDPLFYILGASRDTDSITVFNEARVAGAISMTGYIFE